jgi:uncharacterized NAD(P)/FAD-binding protein YdhS
MGCVVQPEAGRIGFAPMRLPIVGGGATGALTALHVARRVGGDQADIVAIEPNRAIGRGVAYSTPDPRRLLNVRVSNMSAFADQPDQLHKWLKRRGSPSGAACRTPFCFIPGATYGDYRSSLVIGLLASGAVSRSRAFMSSLRSAGPIDMASLRKFELAASVET